MPQQLYEKNWDYSSHAQYYEYRPNYSRRAIDALTGYVGAKPGPQYRVADIGAGTGNLSILLLQRGLEVTAVEPNDEMRGIGQRRTENFPGVSWVKAGGTQTTLDAAAFDWVTFGSSFNVMDQDLALAETHRILKPQGFFTCMWNHRDLNDPVQAAGEAIIERFVPQYQRGVRREDQRPVLERNRHLFRDICFLESDFMLQRTIEEYLKAWASVKNRYWDFSSDSGRALFAQISAAMRQELPAEFSMRYTTRAWTAQKID